jgi:O-antigen/teichoic acid export membrane protein
VDANLSFLWRGRLLDQPAMKLQATIARLTEHSFLRSVAVLVSGTGVAAALSALALPILTRLYTPHDFSTLAVFNGLVATISVAACLRFDVAVPMPERDTEAINVLALAALCTLAIAVLAGLVAIAMPTSLLARYNQLSIEPYLWLVAPGVLLTACYSALQFWFIRKTTFATVAQNRMSQACAAAGTQISLGWLGIAPLGLVLGPLVSAGVGCLGLGYRFVATARELFANVTWSNMRAVFVTYHRFPRYSALEALCNAAAIQLPVIMIAGMASGPEAGYLLLALFVIQAPMGLLGTAIAQVYLSRAPDEFRADRLGAFTAKVIGGLLATGVGPLIFAGLLAPDLFAHIFGDEWRRAGVLMLWMTPWFVMQFLASPISMSLHVVNRQRAALILQVFCLLLRVSMTYGAAAIAGGHISETYAASGLIFYTVYFLVVLRVVGVPAKLLSVEFVRSMRVVLAWTLAGIAIAMVLPS